MGTPRLASGTILTDMSLMIIPVPAVVTADSDQSDVPTTDNKSFDFIDRLPSK